MKNTIVHHEGAASLEAVASKVKPKGAQIKIGLDMHARVYVAVAQYDHLLPKAARRLSPNEFVPWVEALLGQGHSVHVVYEACGFGFSLYRQLMAAGAQCYVIAPRKLDEEYTRVKTDPRDATTLCQRLSRYLEGNTRELAVIRVPTEEEEQARHVTRQREQLVHHRQKLEAQGRSLLINHALPAPAQLEATAPPHLPAGLGKLTSVMLTREICDWHRFNNRRAISSYTGLCPGERSSGSKRIPGNVTKRGNPRLRAALVECAWRMVRFQPQYPPVQKRLALLQQGSPALGAVRKEEL